MFMYWIEGRDKDYIAELLDKSIRTVDRYLNDGLELILHDEMAKGKADVPTSTKPDTK